MLVGYLNIILHENDQLKSACILSSFEEQQRAVQDNISEIAEIRILKYYKRKVEEFSGAGFSSNYIDKEVKSTLKPFIGIGCSNFLCWENSRIETLLNFLEDTDKR